jgi:hypothetical protein
MTSESQAPTPEEQLLEDYLDLIERHGANSKEAQAFRDLHKDDPNFADLVAMVTELDTTRRKAVLGRRVVNGIWITSAVLVAIIGWIAVQRAIALAVPYWGLNQPRALADLEKSPSAPSFYQGLAKVATQGPDRWPDEPILLAQRISEYRLGCTRVLYAEKQPLGENERKILDALCYGWSGKLDTSLDDLDRRTRPVAEIRAEVEATIKLIGAKLQARAGELEVAQATHSEPEDSK